MTEVPPELIAAYEATHYKVLEPKPFTLRVGHQSPELQSMYADLGVSSAAYLTAWNPFSVQTSDEANRQAQQELVQKLSLAGFGSLAALGVDPSGEWRGEDSVFVPGLSLDQARSLGVEFGQNAIVWADANAVPQLILLR